jgi:DNA-directed RNA polymerase specialized sigma24 family protein
MIRAFKSRSRCASQAAPDGWVRTIARREAYRRFIARRNSEQPLDVWAEVDAAGPGPAEIEGLLDVLAARDVLNHVPVADRALLMRRYVLDQSSAQIALDLALPAATVRVRLHRAVKRLREFERDWS